MLRFDALAPTATPAFEALYAIYAEAIESSEQKTRAELHSAICDPRYRFIAALEAGVMVGFSIVYLPLGADIWVLEYLAIAPEHEGRGVGGQLFSESAAMAGPGRLGLIEADADTGEERGSARRRRRLRFYARTGCRQLGDISYLLPLTANGAPPPMDLLVHAPSAIAYVPVATAQAWLRLLYVEVYGQPGDDPRIASMLAGQSPIIPLRPIDSYNAGC